MSTSIELATHASELHAVIAASKLADAGHSLGTPRRERCWSLHAVHDSTNVSKAEIDIPSNGTVLFQRSEQSCRHSVDAAADAFDHTIGSRSALSHERLTCTPRTSLCPFELCSSGTKSDSGEILSYPASVLIVNNDTKYTEHSQAGPLSVEHRMESIDRTDETPYEISRVSFFRIRYGQQSFCRIITESTCMVYRRAKIVEVELFWSMNWGRIMYQTYSLWRKQLLTVS